MVDTPPPAVSANREWAPRLWEGCDFFAWLRLLLRNRCAIHPRYAYIAFIITFISLFHTVLRLIQNSWLGRRAKGVRPRVSPLFIIGHWRTGTTLLHELLILDPRHTFPSTYQCFVPNHFLLTESLFSRLFPWLLPSHRPMDNMPAGWDRPQEDEFALCLLGQPSPYLTIAFPNHPPQDVEAFDLDRLSPRALASWKQTFLHFLGQLSLKDSRRLILKSPTHSCRIPTLLELFPDAKFVHIVRNPYTVFPSTVNLWKSLYETHGLQVPTFVGLREYVFQTYTHLYERIEEGKKLLQSENYYELRYEDLIANPLGQLELLYKQLGLGDFELARPYIEHYLKKNASYRTNSYKPLPPELEAEITQCWGDVIRRYGYERRSAAECSEKHAAPMSQADDSPAEPAHTAAYGYP